MHMGLRVFYYSLILIVFSQFAKSFGHFHIDPLAPPATRSARPFVFDSPGYGLCLFTVVHRAIPLPDICFHLLPTIRHRFDQTNLVNVPYFH